MKNLFFKAIALVAIIVFNSGIYAQVKYYKGYVVMLKGDTLKGEIKKNIKKEFDNFTKAAYRKSEGGEIKTFNATKIKEYHVDGTTFVSRNIEGEQVFIKLISEGVVNLYEAQIEVYQMNELKIKSDFYMEKLGEVGPVKIKSGKFKKQVQEVMSDNEAIVKDLEEKKYDFDNIVEVFNAYNKSAKN
ncbi:MAG: hypothetical protein H0W84_03055 [Bacteroidetes bacterium]|nr:hypothetical protein [Bacteroidota bacterium]